MHIKALAGLAAAAGLAFAAPSGALAGPNLVTNGGFEQTPLAQSAVLDPGDSTSITGWTNNATFTLLIFPGEGDNESGGLGGFALWGPGNGVNNGLTATSPAGGNYVGLDSDVEFRGTGLQQTISGLTPGQHYTLSFYFAAGQEEGDFDGPTTEQIQATLGGQTVSTEVLTTPVQGFSPWHLETFNLIASGTSELLQLLAVGGPSGAPPISLIDGVSLIGSVVNTPEPAAWTLLLVGIAGVAGAARMRRRK